MTSGVFGGGVIFVVASLLWAAVLVPSWVRRREFKAAEQNALRLQRTLRVLAETAEVPTEVRVEATAREALAQERLLRTAQKRQDAERRAELTEARTEQIRAELREQQLKRKQANVVRAAKLRRPVVRRARSFAALVLVLACAATLIGAGMLIAGLGPALLLGSIAAIAGSLGVLVLLAPGRVKHVQVDAERVVPATAPRTAAPAPAAITVDRSAEVHAAAQAAAAARITRARALARSRAEGVTGAATTSTRRNQQESILLEEGRVTRVGVNADQNGRGAAAGTDQTASGMTQVSSGEVQSGDGAARFGSAGSGAAANAGAGAAGVAVSSAHTGAGASGAGAAASASAVGSAAAASLEAVGQAKAPRAASAQARALAAEMAATERLRKMGVVGDTSDGALDLDAVLRTRRAG